MRTRFMRIILFFDLPMENSEELKEYTKFRKNLIAEGFIMMQKSVYSKLVLNQTSVNLVKKRIEKVKPSKGLVQILVVTEKQFSRMDYIVGSEKNDGIIKTEERLIIL